MRRFLQAPLRTVGPLGLLAFFAWGCADDLGSSDLDGDLTIVDVSVMVGGEALTQQCIAEEVTVEASGWPDCTVFVTDPTCGCDGPWRAAPAEPARLRLAEEMVDPAQGCLCAVPRLTGQDRKRCLDGAPTDDLAAGWCYADQTVMPPVGTAQAVAECPADAARGFRFGAGGLDVDDTDASVLFVCRR